MRWGTDGRPQRGRRGPPKRGIGGMQWRLRHQASTTCEKGFYIYSSPDEESGPAASGEDEENRSTVPMMRRGTDGRSPARERRTRGRHPQKVMEIMPPFRHSRWHRIGDRTGIVGLPCASSLLNRVIEWVYDHVFVLGHSADHGSC